MAQVRGNHAAGGCDLQRNQNVLWFNPLSDLVLMRAERLDSRANALSTKATEVIQRLDIAGPLSSQKR
jgi:hypothetical protein